MSAVFAMKNVVLILSSLTIWNAGAAQFANSGSAEVLFRGRDVVAELNRDSFKTTVLKDDEYDSAKWLVLFCKKNDARCESMMPSLVKACTRMADRSKSGIVRVAKVDCEAHADLCSEQGIMTFPTVAHYHLQQIVADWTSGQGGLAPWLQGELLQDSLPQATAKISGKIQSAVISLVAPVCSISHMETIHEWILLEDCLFAQTLSFMLLLAILGKSAWIIVVGGELKSWSRDVFIASRPLEPLVVMQSPVFL